MRVPNDGMKTSQVSKESASAAQMQRNAKFVRNQLRIKMLRNAQAQTASGANVPAKQKRSSLRSALGY